MLFSYSDSDSVFILEGFTPFDENMSPWRSKEDISPSQLLKGVKGGQGVWDQVGDPEKGKEGCEETGLIYLAHIHGVACGDNVIEGWDVNDGFEGNSQRGLKLESLCEVRYSIISKS